MEKGKQVAATIDEYIASFPAETRERLEVVREIVRKEAPEAVEAIKYDMPTFVLNGNMVCFAAFSKHLSVFPITDAMERVIPDVSQYRSGVATAKFPHSKPLPIKVITEMVRFRVKEYRLKKK